jgi:hypothetical protein
MKITKEQSAHPTFDTEREAIQYLNDHPDYCLMGYPRTRNIDLLFLKSKGISEVTVDELKELIMKNGRFDAWIAIGWNASSQKFVVMKID